MAAQFCRRGNARGVDLNRNWPTPGWGGREAEHARRDCDPGPAPFSEPETRTVAATQRRRPLAVYGDDEQQCTHHGSIVTLVLGCGAPRNDE